jgi:membrane protein implicated in regulation of membrane protease activity
VPRIALSHQLLAWVAVAVIGVGYVVADVAVGLPFAVRAVLLFLACLAAAYAVRPVKSRQDRRH